MTNDNVHHLDPTAAPRFPILDATRTVGNAELGRDIYADLGHVEPYIEEVDAWCTLPLRLVFDQAAAVHLELGPYDLDHVDIERLRAAIAAYDEAAGR